MADVGADIIKVEPPGGDKIRGGTAQICLSFWRVAGDL